MGETEIPLEVFDDFLNDAAPKYVPEKYNLIEHNCNNFTN